MLSMTQSNVMDTQPHNSNNNLHRLKFRNPSSTARNWLANSKYHFAADFAQEIYRSKTVYTHIPKNASSTMRYSVALANGLITSDTDISWVYANNMTFVPSLSAQLTAAYTFVILRCPYSRLASAFLDQLMRRPHMFIMRQQKKGVYRRIVDKLISGQISFERFVLKLFNQPDFLRLNAHWRPQVDFLLYDTYDDYFSVENMAFALAKLKNKINLEVIDSRPLAKHGIDRYIKINIEDGFKLRVPEIQQMKATNTILDPRCLYSKRLIEIVAEIYADDIKLYVEKFGEDNLMFKRL